MPIEYTQLKDKPMEPMDCHYCGAPLRDDNDLLIGRGLVQSFWRQVFGRPYCALICRNCHSVGGWEKP